MAKRLFILIKKRGRKGFLGAVPVRNGLSPSILRKRIPKQIKRGFGYKIITMEQLKKLIVKQRPKLRIKRRRTIRRRLKRKK